MNKEDNKYDEFGFIDPFSFKEDSERMSKVEETKEMIKKIDENIFCIPSITDKILMDISISLAIIADKMASPTGAESGDKK